MNPSFAKQIETSIADGTGQRATIQSTTFVGGGCINQAQKIQLDDGRQFFVKSNRQNYSDMFAREASGLTQLRSTQMLRVPQVMAHGQTADETYLILEFIPTGRRSPGFFETFGRKLAELHRQHTVELFGNENDNFIGSTVQPNNWTGNWIEFWAEHRIGFQLDLAHRNGHRGQLQSLGMKLVAKLPQLLKTTESRPSLLHGDLWNGNFMADADGEPVLIDPAVYFGHREAEFGMTTLFGGFDDAFYDSYNEVSPLEEGAMDRIAIYRLYHLLNHLNLFGGSYLAGCLEILKKYT